MATKQQWLDHVEARKKYEKDYAKETEELAKKLDKLPDGEVVIESTTEDNPPVKPPNP